jgi:exodeoxyribonuclease VII small subunit
VSFEESLGQLEAVVHDLEEGGLGLEEALARYEEGVRHLRRCYRALRHAERKIELLAGIDAEGEPITEPLDEPASQDAEEAPQKKPASREQGRRGTGQQRDVAKPLAEDDLDGPPTLF